ncbi:MAG: hypothetical protein WD795_14840 [Woeseia sp.]
MTARARSCAVRRGDAISTIRAFEAGEIDAAGFDHEAHVRIAWSYLQDYPAAIAIARFTSALKSLTTRLAMPHKYHETVSWFFMIVIANRMADRLDASQAHDWHTFKTENNDLFEHASALLHRHYSSACLGSTNARQRFVLPDLAP